MHRRFTGQAHTETFTITALQDFTMTTSISFKIKTLALAVALSTGTLALAADPVTDLMQAANGPYRMALYKTNGKSQEEALQTLTQAQEMWAKLASQFSAKPAAPYDRDPAFAASVAEVNQVYEQALKQVKAGELTAAHNTLEQPKGLLQLTAQAGALSYLAKQLDAQAPANLKANPEFANLLKAVNQSVSNLEAALLNQDAAAAKEAASKLKGPYGKLFAKFG